MSITTNVYENGRWITVTQDPYQILAQNRSQQEQILQPCVKPRETPEHGLLTKTLACTPVTKWIFPAKVRHCGGTDVIFVSEDSIRIDEVFEDRAPICIHAQRDFDVPITNAYILGASAHSVSNGDDFMPQARPVQPTTSQLDGGMQVDADASGASGQVDIDKVNGFCQEDPSKHKHLPSQLLILILANTRIAFAHVATQACEQIRLAFSSRPLPKSGRRTYQLGEHLAVDPRSRAMAVGARERDFYLYALKSWSQMNHEYLRGDNCTPIEAERLFQVDGLIMNLEFLHCEHNSEDLVILMLLVSKNGKSKLTWYEWDTKVKLHEAQITSKSLSLPNEDSLPLFIIPLKAKNAFVLVNREKLAVYENLLAGTPGRHLINVGTQEAANESMSSRNQPIWVDWARAIRYRTDPQVAMFADDNVYLCREDGLVIFLDIKNNVEHMIESHHIAGKLDSSINGSFALIDMGERAVDLLVTGGVSGSGGYWQIFPRLPAERSSILHKWSPLADCVLTHGVPGKSDARALNGHVSGNGLYGCMGRASDGRIGELQLGNIAESVDSIALQGAFDSTILDMWTLFPSDDECWVLISHPSNSSLLRVEEGLEPELRQDHQDLELNSRTLAAHDLPEGQICQITTHFISWFSDSNTPRSQSYWRCDLEQQKLQALTACLGVLRGTPYYAMAAAKVDQYMLFVGLLRGKEKAFNEPITLASYPTCVTLGVRGQFPICIVGCEGGTVDIFASQSTERDEFQSVAAWAFSSANQICDSLAAPTEQSNEQDGAFLICGLRNGQIHVLDLADESWDLSKTEEIGVGNTTIRLKRMLNAIGRVFVLCDTRLCELQFPIHGIHRKRRPVGILRPIIVDRKRAVEVFGFAPPQGTHASRNIRSPLLVTAGTEEMNFLKLTQPALHQSGGLSVLPQSYHLTGTPVKVIFSEFLKKFIVLYHITKVARAPDSNGRRHAGKRSLLSRLAFLEHEPECADLISSQGGEHLLSTKPGEKTLGLLEWFPLVDDMRYHILVINSLVRDAHRPPSGRLHFYALTKEADDTIRILLKKSMDVTGPIYSIAPFRNGSSMVYCSGHDLNILRVDAGFQGFKCNVTCRLNMRSPGRHLTIQGLDIYVSTAYESLQIYRYEDNQLRHVTGDTISRNGLVHVPLQSTGLTVATDMCGGIIGLWRSQFDQANNEMRTVFEAAMPRATTRILAVDRPAERQDILQPGGAVVLQVNVQNQMGVDKSPSTMSSTLQIVDYRPGALLGVSSDGTIIQMLVLSKGWRLLKFLQDVSDSHPKICPLRGHRRSQQRKSTSFDPHHAHIDGDILDRLLQRGDVALLEEMLGHPRPSIGNSEDLWSRFTKLSEELFGQSYCGEIGRQQLLEEVIRWLSYILRSAL